MSIEKFLSNVVVDGTISKVGGTSTQFLKADGSVDANSYALASSLGNYLPLTGGTLTGGLSGISGVFSSRLNTPTIISTSIRSTSFDSLYGDSQVANFGTDILYLGSASLPSIWLQTSNTASGVNINGNPILHSGNFNSYAAAASGSANYIQNQNASAQSADMWISGSIRNSQLTLRSDSLEEFSSDSDNGVVAVNFNGYNGGTSRFRDFRVFNGKQATVLHIIGSTGAATFTSTVTASPATLDTQLATLGQVKGIADLKAPIASPALTGIPTAPTAAAGTNTTQVATTAFVLANAPVTPDATTSVKGKIKLAGDLGGTADLPTVPALAAKAPIASPAFTGTPTAPTAAPGTNTEQIATTAFVQANSSARPYKVYTALLTQSGTNAPVATVLENTLGGTVVWSYSITGEYIGTLNGAFLNNKTFLNIKNNTHSSNTEYTSSIGRINIDKIVVGSKINGTSSDGAMLASIEIRVYN